MLPTRANTVAGVRIGCGLCLQHWEVLYDLVGSGLTLKETPFPHHTTEVSLWLKIKKETNIFHTTMYIKLR